MKIFKHKKKIIFFLIIFGPVIWWNVNFPSGSWRYKITVEVETPEGIKSGSAVRRVYVATPFIKLPDAGVSTVVEGEAVVVDLGIRGNLFALIDWNSYNEVVCAFPFSADFNEHETIYYYSNLKIGSTAVLNACQPKIVTYKNKSDLESLEVVYEQIDGQSVGDVDGVIDNFSNIFGDGVRLKNIIIEITDEPMTWGRVDPYMPEFGNQFYSIGYMNFKRWVI